MSLLLCLEERVWTMSGLTHQRSPQLDIRVYQKSCSAMDPFHLWLSSTFSWLFCSAFAAAWALPQAVVAVPLMNPNLHVCCFAFDPLETREISSRLQLKMPNPQGTQQNRCWFAELLLFLLVFCDYLDTRFCSSWGAHLIHAHSSSRHVLFTRWSSAG